MIQVISPPKGWLKINFKEIWQHRELLYILIWRNIKVRYKQTIVGITWVIFQPLFNMAIFTVIFSKLIKIPSEGVPYAVFVFSGLMFWGYFNAALYGANMSLVEGQNILKKVYFPRLIIPFATTITPIVDFALVFLVFLGIMAYFRITPHILGIILLPLFIFICFLSATGLGLLLASINVRYRDVQYILGFILQAMFYAVPIIYPLSVIPSSYHWIVYSNPLTAPIVLLRSTLLKTSAPDWRLLGISFAISSVLFIIGLIYFVRSEKYFADEL